MKSLRALFFLLLTFAFIAPLHAEAPAHFKNPPENLNPDPAYVPGDYALAEMSASRTVYHAKKTELAGDLESGYSGVLTTLAAGEISFVSTKNETASVPGSFHDFFGVAKFNADGSFQDLRLLIDINSLDTGVPGRNNRLLNILFESMKPDFGTAEIHFDKLDSSGKKLSDAADGESIESQASGTITLHGTTREITAALFLKKQGTLWIVETREPVKLLISDFGFEERVYELMKACNHKSIGNSVGVNVKLYFK